MTKLFEAYLKFVERNKEKLQKATSDTAYDCETYFECFYDAANDEVYLNCDVGCDITEHLSTPEELNEYQETLDKCVDIINEAATLD